MNISSHCSALLTKFFSCSLAQKRQELSCKVIGCLCIIVLNAWRRKVYIYTHTWPMRILGISCRRVGFRCSEEDSYRFSAVSIFLRHFPFCRYYHWQMRKRCHPLLASTMADDDEPLLWPHPLRGIGQELGGNGYCLTTSVQHFFSFLYDYDCLQCFALLAECLRLVCATI